MIRTSLAAALLFAAAAAHADAVDALREFVRDVKTGQAAFTQTVTSPDGAKKKTSSGRFEFARPNRFRFVYTKPFEQTIVADGQKIWIHDPDLNQVSSRKIDQALGTTPAALLTGGSIDKDFELSAQPASGGLEWAQALPKVRDGAAFQSLRIGFKGKEFAAIEIVDSFGQRSRLDFSQVVANPALAPDTFTFTVPKGADVLQQ
jgi:outer membrane lipoprotein carrier protein